MIYINSLHQDITCPPNKRSLDKPQIQDGVSGTLNSSLNMFRTISLGFVPSKGKGLILQTLCFSSSPNSQGYDLLFLMFVFECLFRKAVAFSPNFKRYVMLKHVFTDYYFSALQLDFESMYLDIGQRGREIVTPFRHARDKPRWPIGARYFLFF